MFLDNLASSVLLLCEEEKLSYERASERCHLSSRYFGDIVRRKSAPTILTLEKLCSGLDTTPNELLLSAETCHQLSFRSPVKVLQLRCSQQQDRSAVCPVCPRCSGVLARSYQRFCDRCGQNLDWSAFSDASHD